MGRADGRMRRGTWKGVQMMRDGEEGLSNLRMK